MFDRVVRTGNLWITDGAGETHRFGDGSGAKVAVRLAGARLEKELVLNPQLVLGEAYMHGRFIVEQGSIYDFLAIVLSNAERYPFPKWLNSADRLRRLTRRIQQYNPAGKARANVAHHYDIDAQIYDLFLDHDRQYSCAYFADGIDRADIEQAQLAKKRHIAAKLALKPGLRVLDIGSGWGGLGLYLAHTAGVDVTGITLSAEQLKFARTRARQQGLGHAARFELRDYRHVKETVSRPFDRIVSVGMFEHVGINHYGAFFRHVRDLLRQDGVALIHAIGRSDEPGATNPFIAKHIFPGGYIPALSEVLPAIERSGLFVTDIEILRLHYADTLRAWRERFLAKRPQALALRGEEFCRMWEFYLAGSEAAFRYQGLMVFQIQLTRRLDALPLTRDYMADAERRLARREGEQPETLRLAGE